MHVAIIPADIITNTTLDRLRDALTYVMRRRRLPGADRAALTAEAKRYIRELRRRAAHRLYHSALDADEEFEATLTTTSIPNIRYRTDLWSDETRRAADHTRSAIAAYFAACRKADRC